jgi:kynurenine formamidase
MYIELSYKLDKNMPIYPGSPEEEIIPITRMNQGDPSNTTTITHFLHNGTHVDAPFHFYNNGSTIDQIPIEDFVYQTPLIIDKKLKKSELLEVEDLKKYGEELYLADILFFYTGYCKIRNNPALYMDNFPAISEETAKFIRTGLLNVKAIAIDVLSIESAILGPKKNFRVHKTLLDRDLYNTRPLLIFEDVNIGKVLNKKIKKIYAFPLRLKGLDASPVNIIAEI